MREILFRGKRLDNGEWVEGYLGQDTLIGDKKTWLGYVIKPIPKKLWDAEWFEVDPATVGQYTGLLDKNGKRIFEGDIVRGPHISDDLMTEPVEFSAVCGWMPFDYLREDLCEVIGNIHDNPELLEEGQV